MNKKIISLAILTILALPVVAMGQAAGGAGHPGDQNTLPGLIEGVKTAAWMIFGAIAVLAFVIAGILFLTAAGNPEKVQQARNAFLWGVAGVVVGIIAYSIISIVQTGTNLH